MEESYDNVLKYMQENHVKLEEEIVSYYADKTVVWLLSVKAKNGLFMSTIFDYLL